MNYIYLSNKYIFIYYNFTAYKASFLKLKLCTIIFQTDKFLDIANCFFEKVIHTLKHQKEPKGRTAYSYSLRTKPQH